MPYSLNHIADFGPPFEVVHEQTVLVPANGHHTVFNANRKILFVLTGECRHQIIGWNGAWSDVRLRPGDILTLPHRCEQRYTGVEPGVTSRLHVIRLAFDATRLPPLTLPGSSVTPLRRERDDKQSRGVGEEIAALSEDCLQEIRYFRGGQDALIRETLAELCDEVRDGHVHHRLRIYSLCVNLMILFSRKAFERRLSAEDAAAPSSSITDFHVSRIKDFLRQNLRRPVSLTEVAVQVRLTEAHTARLFKKATGLTLQEYARRQRIAEAKKLLVTTEENLSEISRAIGFASLTVFSRNFKQEAGVTPSEFRRQIARQIG